MTQPHRRYPSIAPLAGALALSLLLGACADGERAPQAAPEAVAPAAAASATADTQPATAEVAAAPIAGAAALIGMRVPPYPDGLLDIVGTCIPGGEGLDHVCDYGMTVLGRGDRDAGTARGVYLVGSRNTDTAAARPVWEITDAVDMPASDGYRLQIADCRIDGQPSRDLAALVRHEGGQEYSADITWARRYDTASGEFVELGDAKVDCVDPAAGV